jgi:DNA-binding NarL/FixJ family response regulator
MTTRILIADDHQLMRQGLCALLDRVPGMQVVAQATDGLEAVRQAFELEPDIVIMDIAMPRLNGIEATRQIRTKCPVIRIIALSMHADQPFVSQVLQAGAAGYLLKDCAFEELELALRVILSGQVYLSPEIAGVVVDHHLRQPARERESAAGKMLTPREREVLQLLAEGRTIRETAALLNVTAKTVEANRQRIKLKLRLRSTAELTRYAIRTGLVSL